MGVTIQMLLCRCLLAVIAMQLFGGLLLAELPMEQQEAVESLGKIWTVHRNEISSASVDGWLYRTGDIKDKQLTGKQIEDIYEEKISLDLEQLNEFDRTLRDRYGIQAAAPTRLKLRNDNGKSREDSYSTRIKTAAHTVQTGNANRQVRITATTADPIFMLGIADLRYVPTLAAPPIVKSMERKDGIVTIVAAHGERQGADYEIEYDESSSVVLKAMLRAGDQPLFSCVQSAFITDSSGITIPRSTLQLKYENGVVRLVQLIVVEECTLNTSIPDHEFAFKAPSGMLVLDERFAIRNEAQETTLASPVDDVVAYADSYRSPAAATQPKPRARSTTLLVALNIVVVFCVFLYLAGKKRFA